MSFAAWRNVNARDGFVERPWPRRSGTIDAEAVRVAGREHELPVGADPGAAVQQEQRLAVAAIFVVQR